MDALRLIEHPSAHEVHYWMGALSMQIAISAESLAKRHASPERVGNELRDTLAQFMTSPVASEGLRQDLRKHL